MTKAIRRMKIYFLYAYELKDTIPGHRNIANILHGSIVFFPKEQFNEKLIRRHEFDITYKKEN